MMSSITEHLLPTPGTHVVAHYLKDVSMFWFVTLVHFRVTLGPGTTPRRLCIRLGIVSLDCIV